MSGVSGERVTEREKEEEWVKMETYPDTRTCMYTHIHTYIHTHTCTHTHTHTFNDLICPCNL